MLNLIKEAKMGNAEAQLEILERYKPLMATVCNCFYIKGYDMSDLYQIAVTETLAVIKKYDTDKYTGFSSYLRTCIRNRMINEIKKAEKAYFNTSLEENVYEKLTNHDVVKCEGVNIEEEYIEKETKEELRKAVEELSEEEKTLIKKKYVDGESTNAYSKSAGVSYYKGAKLEKEIIEKLKSK